MGPNPPGASTSELGDSLTHCGGELLQRGLLLLTFWELTHAAKLENSLFHHNKQVRPGGFFHLVSPQPALWVLLPLLNHLIRLRLLAARPEEAPDASKQARPNTKSVDHRSKSMENALKKDGILQRTGL